MKTLLSILCLMALTAGCASHYQKIQKDRLVLFLKKPHAQQVILACSLDGFEPRKAQKHDGQWVVSLPAQYPFQYFYIIDGKTFLPACPMKEQDDFGSENCIFEPHSN